MKKKLLLSLCLIFCCITVFGMSALAIDGTPKLDSYTACVIDADTGEIVYQKRANIQQRPASITKQMTALLVMEHIYYGDGSLDDKVKVTNKSLQGIDPMSTRIGFEPGEKRSVRDLMNCMLIESANDAANLLAYYVAGDVDTFVDMMNERAKQIGCTNTHFDNPNGLDPDDDSIHLSTAHDMALISYRLLDFPEYFDFAGATGYMLETDKIITEPWGIGTKVDMLLEDSEFYNPEVYAGKTGWTSKANHTMCLYMKRDDRNLVMCVMNSPYWTMKFEDCERLMDYVCDNYVSIPVSAAKVSSILESSGMEVSLDSEALEERGLHVLVPSSIHAEDLDYSIEMIDGTPTLTVGISADAADVYKQATHVGAKKSSRLITAALPTSDGTLADSSASASGSGAVPFSIHNYSRRQLAKIGATILAMLLVLLSVLFLLIRTAIRRKKAEKKKNEPLVIVIPTPDKYKEDMTDITEDKKK